MPISLRMNWLAVKHIICVCKLDHVISFTTLVYLFLTVSQFSLLGIGFLPWFNTVTVVRFVVDRLTLWLSFIVLFYFTHINLYFASAS